MDQRAVTPLIPAHTEPPHHIAKRHGKDVVIETRAIHVEKYGMNLDHFQRNIRIALEDEDVAADDVSIHFDTDVEYDESVVLKCRLTWYRPATPEDKQANKDWMAAREAERKASEQQRVRQLIVENPDAARAVLTEIETAAKNNKGGRG